MNKTTSLIVVLLNVVCVSGCMSSSREPNPPTSVAGKDHVPKHGWAETTGSISNITTLPDGKYVFSLIYRAGQSTAKNADGRQINGEIEQHCLGKSRRPIAGQALRLRYMIEEPIIYELIDEIKYAEPATGDYRLEDKAKSQR
jgi:hypothetical protein